MKLTFLGTSAGESYPALWCRCPHCTYARAHGGKNVRQNSCALLDGDVMLDFSSHVFHTALTLGLDITGIRYLLVTHDHRDHFDPQHLIWRMLPLADGAPQAITHPFDMETSVWQMGARHTPLPHLNIYGHSSVYTALRQNPRFHEENMEYDYDMSFHALSRGECVRLSNGLTVTALVSHHGTPGSVLNYILERDGHTLLYALDCGGYDDDMIELLKGHRFNCVVLEGTFGHMPVMNPMHQNKEKNLQMLDFFNKNHLWAGSPRMILSHMAPHWTPPHDLYSAEMAKYGINVAYDGMVVEF